MRFLVPVALLATSLSTAQDAPRKSGSGFLGFGSRPREQISSALFPEQTAPAPANGPRVSENIFKDGKPTKVEPVSYVIENGRRVERPVTTSLPAAPVAQPAVPALDAATTAALAEPAEKKKGGLFGFGKKDEVPSVEPIVAPAAAPTLTAAPLAVPTPAPPASVPRPMTAEPVPVVEKEKKGFFDKRDDEPSFASESKRGSWIPFMGRKKEADPLVAAVPPVTAEPLPQASPVTPAAAPAKPAAKPATAEAPAVKSDKPASFTITRDDSKPQETKKKDTDEAPGGGILTPLTKIRPPQKEIDLTGAETIIQNGEIVAGSSTSFPPTSASQPSSPRQAPQVIDGVKTYSSWDDVDARSQSAADKILNRIR